MARKTKMWDNRKRYECFVCEKGIESIDKAKMVVSESPYINLFIHKECDRPVEELEEIINEKKQKYIGV